MTQLPGPTTAQLPRLLKLAFNPTGYLEQYRHQYGDLFKVGRKPPYIVYVSHPEAAQAVFSSPSELFTLDSSGGDVLTTLLGDNSVLLLDGDRHQRQRKLLMPPFHGDRLRTYGELMVAVTQRVSDTWTPRQPIRVRAPMQDITLRVILRAVFGVTEERTLKGGETRFEQFRQSTSAMLEALSSPLAASMIFFPSLQRDWGQWSPWGRFLGHKRRVDELIYAEIQERRAAIANQTPLGDDILSLLITAVDEAGQTMSDVELHDELMTLLVAGHETTASALTWAMYWIHATPGVETTLRQELDDLGPKASPSEVTRLPYLNAVCQESLRVYPVTLTTGVRRLRSPMTLMGYDIEAGTILFPCMYLVHQNPEIYPEPKRFRPERFLERLFSPIEFMPFGGGHRYCIGAAMATMEMKLVLATVLSQWRFRPVTRKIKPVRRGLTLAPPANFSMVPAAAIAPSR
ncbi:MAG: cytochrome P450 [Elainellaceae cyanobacterium]